jgi:RimJ/RimL family protein N-acetyltransferase
MITSRFLLKSEYPEYGDWMKSQSIASRNVFFGYQASDENIDKLVEGIVANPDDHHFLVLEKSSQWIGTLHIAKTGDNDVEFGFMLDPDYRGQGYGDRLMDEGLTWARNRGYREVFLHCVANNKPIQFLCHKHGLEVTTEHGESETKAKLPPADLYSITKEVSVRQRQAWRMMLQTAFPVLDAID